MTVLVREELNAADLAWAAADHSLAQQAREALQARVAIADERPVAAGPGDSLAVSAPTGLVR